MNHQSRFNAWYWMLGAGALRRPREMVQGGRREGRSKMGNTCIPVVDSCWCMAKPIQYCKVINLQLNKFIFLKIPYVGMFKLWFQTCTRAPGSSKEPVPSVSGVMKFPSVSYCSGPCSSAISHLLSLLQSVTLLVCSLYASVCMPAVVLCDRTFQCTIL